MKRKLYISGVLLLAALGLSSFYINVVTYRKPDVKRTAFDTGEEVTYKLHYGFVTAGYGKMKIVDKLYNVNGKKCYRYDVLGVSTSAISWFVKVQDKWTSYVDTTSLYPEIAKRDIKENRYRMYETLTFNQSGDSIRREFKKRDDKDMKNRTYKSAPKTHDIVSAYYYLRNIDYTKLREGDRINLSAFIEDELYDFYLVYQGKDVVKTPMGKIRAFRLVPQMPDNSLFDGENSVQFWVSDDKNRLPVKVEADMFVGSVEMDLLDYSNLKYPLNFVSKD